MRKDKNTQEECENARKNKMIPSMFAEIVEKDKKLKKACGTTQDITEKEMKTLWKTFIKYTEQTREHEEGDPYKNLEEYPRGVGQISEITWIVGEKQRAFLGGRETDPDQKGGKGGKKEKKVRQ